MKKSIIALMGLFTLIACSEDSYQEAGKMNETRNSTVENTGTQNSVKTSSSPGFPSPYEERAYGTSIIYAVSNSTPYILELTPYIGLAYYDGLNDGIYNNPNLSTPINLATSGSYPNLYAGSKEYLNLIKGPTMSFAPFSGHTDLSAGNHCPTLPGQSFDLQSVGATLDEANILSDGGKVYYLDVTIKNAAGVIVRPTQRIKHIFNPVGNTPFTSFGDWNYLPITIPGFSEPFYSNIYSKEITSGTWTGGSFPSADALNFTLGGVAYDIHYHSVPGVGAEGMLVIF